jgi:hypothetical protein
MNYAIETHPDIVIATEDPARLTYKSHFLNAGRRKTGSDNKIRKVCRSLFSPSSSFSIIF